MQRQVVINGVLLALALGTFGVVWATRDAATTGQLAARRNQLLPELDTDKVSSLRFSRAGQVLELRRDGSEFRIVAPWAERADVATTTKWLTAADMATAERPADGVSDARAGFDAGAFRATLELAGRRLSLTLGGPAPTPTGARYAKVESGADTRVSVVRGSVASELEVPFDRFRETRLLEYGKRELARIELESPAGHVELEQREHGAFFVRVGARWELAGPALDPITAQLAQLSTEQFVEPEPARAALPSNALRVKLQPKDKVGEAVTLTLGGVCPLDPARALLLREQPGRAARAGCIAQTAAANLTQSPDALRLLGPFAANQSEIEELRIVRGSRKLDLARKDKAFVLRAPASGEVPLSAGNQRIDAILAATGELSEQDVVGSGDGELSIQVAGGDQEAHREERVLLGKPRPDKSVCFKRIADGVTRCVPGDRAAALEPDARLLRSLSLLSFAPSELSSLRVEAPDFRELLTRNSDGSYELREPKGFAYDAALVTDAVQGLGTLEAERWVAPDEPPELGLSQPALRVTIQLTTEPTPRELVIGASVRGSRYARLSPDPSVFTLAGPLYETLRRPLIDRALCPYGDAELARVELRAGRSAAFRNVEGPLREALAALRASGVEHLGGPRGAEGFDPPRLELSFVAKDTRRQRVLIGKCESSPAHSGPEDAPGATARCYARRDGVDATFTIERDMAQSLRKLITE